MRNSFEEEVLADLLSSGVVGREHSILAICAGASEAKLFSDLELRRATLSNVDGRIPGDSFGLRWERADAQRLPFPDKAFDFGFVSDGIHHCSSPHRALLELYRVSRIGIAIFEARESFLMRIANRLDLSPVYELGAVIYDDLKHGGVDNSQIPNFIFRWTEREFEKTIRSYDPTGDPRFRYYHRFAISADAYVVQKKGALKALALRMAIPVITSVLGALLKKQGNQFAMIAIRPSELFPWLKEGKDGISLNEEYVRGTFKERTGKYSIGNVPGKR